MDSEISVILPVYNAGDYLSIAIESILNQTYKKFEFIIINDGSTDDSLQVIEHYAAIDDRVVVISRENKGLIYTLNEGIQLSHGDYIVRMDQDDISIDNRLEVQYKHIIMHNLDICGGNYAVINEFGERMYSYYLLQNDFEILLCMASNVPFPHPSVMIKKSFLKLNKLSYGMNGYRQAEDLDLWLSMFNVGANFGNVGDTILEYRVLPTSMSRVNHKEIMREKDKQFDIFMKENINGFEKAFRIFFSKKRHSKESQQVVVKAAMRWFFLKQDFSMLFKCLKSVQFYNFIFGVLSFFKLKLSKL